MKPHFRKVDGQWRLYRDRKELRRGCLIWYDLSAKTLEGVWAEYTVRVSIARSNIWREPQ